MLTLNLKNRSHHMPVDVDHPQDSDLITDTGAEVEEDVAPKLTGKEASQHTLEIRRKLEDRLERKRLKDQLGFDDVKDVEF
jgi:hypothetical protein